MASRFLLENEEFDVTFDFLGDPAAQAVFSSSNNCHESTFSVQLDVIDDPFLRLMACTHLTENFFSSFSAVGLTW